MQLFLQTTCKTPHPPAGPAAVEKDTLPAVDKKLLLGLFEPQTHPDFVAIPARYASREGMYMRREAWQAFLRMHAAAAKDGITLRILSATRNFDYQKGIWERKWNQRSGGGHVSDEQAAGIARDILLYSSMPGSSRHHWGTDIDLNALESDYFDTEEGRKLYAWLQKHAPDHGFCQTYTSKTGGGRTGYEEEKWHWSYMPLSAVYLESYRRQVSYEDIQGFAGSKTAPGVRLIEDYVMGIDKSCQR